jgi:hypothetical protein
VRIIHLSLFSLSIECPNLLDIINLSYAVWIQNKESLLPNSISMVAL